MTYALHEGAGTVVVVVVVVVVVDETEEVEEMVDLVVNDVVIGVLVVLEVDELVVVVVLSVDVVVLVVESLVEILVLVDLVVVVVEGVVVVVVVVMGLVVVVARRYCWIFDTPLALPSRDGAAIATSRTCVAAKTAIKACVNLILARGYETRAGGQTDF